MSNHQNTPNSIPTDTINALVTKFGRKHRKLIVSSLGFLDEHEASWGLNHPIDRQTYVRLLVEKSQAKS